MSIKTVADLTVEVLGSAGVQRVFGVVGDSLNGFTEAIRKRGGIEWVHVRHEEVAAFAASAAAQVTGSLAVCAGSCGPGNLHLINGLFDAHRSRAPVLAIAAQIPTTEIGGGYFQETHPQILFQECSCYCELVSEPSQLPFVLENAIRAAVGRNDVAVVVIPGDIALQKAPERLPSIDLVPPKPLIQPTDGQIQSLASILNDAKRITLLCGRGCAGAHAEVITLAEILKSPIVHALGGKEWIEYDNPYDVGMTGLIGFASGYAAMRAADVIVMLGTDFPYKQFLPLQAKIAQVDIRPENLGRRCRLELGLVGDVGLTIRALISHIEEKTNRVHLDTALAHYKHARTALDNLALGTHGQRPIHPQFVARIASEMAASDVAFTADVGTPTIWAARYLKMNGRRRLIGSWVHGSMANAMAHAIGIQAACPKRQVISLSGDGGFTMLMGDLITLKQCDLPVKVIIFNNGSLGFVALEMKAAGLLNFGVDLQNPDFAAMARAMGLHAIRVEDPGDLKVALSDILSHSGPALLDVVVAKEELALPPEISMAQLEGFGLFMFRAIINGQGNELIEIAEDNLLAR